jgi:uncharacterized phage protein gp47/JayE
MAWTAPDLETISRRIRADFRANMPGTEPGIWPNNLYVVTKVFAGIAEAFYQRVQRAMEQTHAHLADSEGIIEHSIEWGVAPEPAGTAVGSLIVTAAIGTTFLAGTRFRRADGKIYVTEDDVLTTEATTIVAVHADEEGEDSNTPADVVMTMEEPIAGFTAAVVEDAGISGGRPGESIASVQAKVLSKKRNPPLGGSPDEYTGLAKSYPGVTRAWLWRATPGPGEVTVSFMMDFAYPDGIPTAGDVAAVTALLATMPGGAKLNVYAPIASPINVTIDALVPDNTKIRSDVTDELRSMIKRRAVPGIHGEPFTFSYSWLDEAISSTQNEDSHILVLPAADIVYEAALVGGAPPIATLGTVTFT